MTPSDQADIKRNVWAGYVDLALDVTSRLLVTGAVRYETYDDSSGDVWSGKVSARYKSQIGSICAAHSPTASVPRALRSRPMRRRRPSSISSAVHIS